MKAVILAGGYANRLRSVTDNGRIAKTLLPIEAEGKNQPILYFLLDKIHAIKDIDEIIVVVNDLYKKQISNACKNYQSSVKFTIVSDGSNGPEQAKGANYAILMANKTIPQDYEDNVLVMASDNYFEFDLNEMVDKYDDISSHVCEPINMVISKVYPDSEREYIANNFGILNLGYDKKINSLDEKPGIENLKTNNVSLAIYMFNRPDLNKIGEYMEQNKSDKKRRDSLGYFINYTIQNSPTYTYEIDGEFCDIGTPDEYYKMRPAEIIYDIYYSNSSPLNNKK